MARQDLDVVGILKWATETRKGFDDRPRRENRQYRPQRHPMDKLFDTFLEDQIRLKVKEMDEKINKQEKKPEKTWWEKLSILQKMAILTATVPPVIMMQGLFFLLLFKAGAMLLGMK
jgi:hypothetical protein